MNCKMGGGSPAKIQISDICMMCIFGERSVISVEIFLLITGKKQYTHQICMHAVLANIEILS